MTISTELGEDGMPKHMAFPLTWDGQGPATGDDFDHMGCWCGERACTQWRPEVVVLCGSTRFYNEFQYANFRLTMEGKIVLSVGFFAHAKDEMKRVHGESVGITPDEKIMLDELHKRKIDLADTVLVLNVGGYVGESTRSEIDYAKEHGKNIVWLEPSDD